MLGSLCFNWPNRGNIVGELRRLTPPPSSVFVPVFPIGGVTKSSGKILPRVWFDLENPNSTVSEEKDVIAIAPAVTIIVTH